MFKNIPSSIYLLLLLLFSNGLFSSRFYFFYISETYWINQLDLILSYISLVLSLVAIPICLFLLIKKFWCRWIVIIYLLSQLGMVITYMVLIKIDLLSIIKIPIIIGYLFAFKRQFVIDYFDGKQVEEN